MIDHAGRTVHYEELLRRFASGVRAAQLYAPDHPLLSRNVDGLLGALQPLHEHQPSIVVGILGTQFVVGNTPMPKASAGMGELIKRLRDHQVERIAFERGITAAEVVDFIQAVSALSGSPDPDSERRLTFPHIRIGRITLEDRKTDGIGGDMATIRRLYTSAVGVAERAWNTAHAEGVADAPAAFQAVDGLADAVTQNRTALVALTAMRSYDNYTFTHMVNVSILTMGQARALGIEGRLLREFGLSALMHDIGKVRTPNEILNKPDQLTDDGTTRCGRSVPIRRPCHRSASSLC
ncbi:MAG: hypothetical protein LC804_01725 [Acidobacteria bacterium]|nr:hypothetical protein [Acidobacteriota bacterium]